MNIAEQITQLKTDFNEVYDAGKEAGKAEGGDTTEILDILITSLKKKCNYESDKRDFSDAFNASLINDELLLEVMKRIDNSEILLAYRIFSGATNIRDALYTGSWDFSQCQSLNAAFQNSTVQNIKKIDARNTLSGHNGMANMFLNCKALESIEEFYPSTKTIFNGTFSGCSNLITVDFASEIAVTGFDLKTCTNLSKKSLMSAINRFKETDTPMTAIFGKTNLAKLTDAEIAIAAEKGWTLLE